MNSSNLPPKVLQAFQKVGKTTSIASVLNNSTPELVKTMKLSEQEVELLKKAVSEKATASHRFVSARDLYLNCGKLSLGCEILDRHLRGGIRSGCITEIYGESATGKTQICLQLCLMVQLPFTLGGKEGGAVYICTEDKFPDRRLEQMKPQFKQKYKKYLKDTNVGDNIYINHIADVKELIDILDNKLPTLIKCTKVRLVVIDSIAALVRVEYTRDEMNERAQVLNRIGARLVHLSGENNMPVICVNQVSAVFDPPVRDKKCKVHDYIKPCLGQTWSDWLSVRIMLFRSTGDCRSETLLPKTVHDRPERELIVVFSRSHDLPVNKPSTLKATHYIVDASGVHGVLVNDTEERCCKCEDI